MTDQAYTYSWIPHGYGARLQRQAVLYPLVGRAGKPEQIVTRTIQLVNIWRARLYSLSKIGWYPGANSKDTQYTRNCPPGFVYTTPHTRQCKFRSFCPFCYARWVYEIWRRLDETFPNPRDVPAVSQLSHDSEEELDDILPELASLPHKGRADRPLRSIDLGGPQCEDPDRPFPFHLLTRSVEKVSPFTRERESETLQAYAAHLLSQVAHARAQSISKMDTPGSFAFTMLVPAEHHWRILHRELHIVPAAYVLVPDVTGEVERIERPSRTRIFQTTAKICEYPRELMYGDVEMTKVALEARQKVRLSGTYGVFRRNRRSL
jgi:hypothetical protein